MAAPNETNSPDALPLFPLGRCVVTPGAVDALADAGAEAADLLRRHQHGDWSGVCAEDREATDAAVLAGTRVISSHVLPGGLEVWVVTEADRSSTTVTLPEEY